MIVNIKTAVLLPNLELCVPYTSIRRELEYDRDRRWSTILSTDIEMMMVGTLIEYTSNNLTISRQDKMIIGLLDYLNSGYEQRYEISHEMTRLPAVVVEK